MISILMPVYNGDKYIRDTIKSVLESTFLNYEFIIINDGSTDNTEKIIKSFSDKRIKYYKKSNSGICETLNYGLKKANHEIIARIDSDDLIFPERLSLQFDYLKKNKIDVLGSNAILINDKKIRFGETNFPINHLQIKSKLENLDCPIVHPSVMYKKDKVIMNGGYNQNYADDYDLWLRMIKNSTFANIKAPLIYLRKHSGNLSSKKIVETQTIKVDALMRYYDFKGKNEKQKNIYITKNSKLIHELSQLKNKKSKLKLIPLYILVLIFKKILLKTLK